MTPKEFLEALLGHYGKRHANDQAEAAWHRDMREVIGNPLPSVLHKAYQIIRDEHEERAFPLPATIKKAIARAWGTMPKSAPAETPEQWIEPTPEEKARVADMVAGLRRDLAAAALPATALPASPDVTRPAMRAMQNTSPSRAAHMTRHGLSEISKRVSGERD